MKIAAHPMVVLVALGLMGPQALADTDGDAPCEGCGDHDGAVPSAGDEGDALSVDEAAAMDALAEALSVAEGAGWGP